MSGVDGFSFERPLCGKVRAAYNRPIRVDLRLSPDRRNRQSRGRNGVASARETVYLFQGFETKINLLSSEYDAEMGLSESASR